MAIPLPVDFCFATTNTVVGIYGKNSAETFSCSFIRCTNIFVFVLLYQCNEVMSIQYMLNEFLFRIDKIWITI